MANNLHKLLLGAAIAAASRRSPSFLIWSVTNQQLAQPRRRSARYVGVRGTLTQSRLVVQVIAVSLKALG